MSVRSSRRRIGTLVCWSMASLAAAVTATPAHAELIPLAGPLPVFPFIKCVVAMGRWSQHADLAHQFGDATAGARVYGGVTLGGDLAGTQVQADAYAGVDGEFLGNDYDLIEATAHADADRSLAHADAALYVLGSQVRRFQVSGPSTVTVPISASWGKVLHAQKQVQVGPITVGGEAQLSVYGGVNGTADLGFPVVKLDLRPYAHGDASASGTISLWPAGTVVGFGNATLVNAEVPFTAEADAGALLACHPTIRWKIDGIAHISGGGGSLGLRYYPPTIWPIPAPDPIEATLLTLPSFTADLPFSGSGAGTI
jgi:hypothetical protein